MIRKTALLTGIAGALLMSAPALAQDAMSPTPAPTQDPAAASPATPAPASGTLQLQPGANVKGSDGTVLGKLEGVRNNDAGEQELTVRGTDGQLRGVPLGGLRQDGADVAVAWTSAEFTAAPAIAADASATPPASEPMSPPASEPMTPPTPEEPTSTSRRRDAATERTPSLIST